MNALVANYIANAECECWNPFCKCKYVETCLKNKCQFLLIHIADNKSDGESVGSGETREWWIQEPDYLDMNEISLVMKRMQQLLTQPLFQFSQIKIFPSSDGSYSNVIICVSIIKNNNLLLHC